VFGVSLGTILFGIVVGLVGPSWLLAVTMLGCGAALALFVAARKHVLCGKMTDPRLARAEVQ